MNYSGRLICFGGTGSLEARCTDGDCRGTFRSQSNRAADIPAGIGQRLNDGKRERDESTHAKS